MSPVTASARRSPLRIRSPPTLKKVKPKAVSPRNTAVLDSGRPRNATIVIFALTILRKSSAAIPVALPRPADAKLTPSGADFAICANSCSVFAGEFFGTIMIEGIVATLVTAAKSAIGSKATSGLTALMTV